MQNILKNIVPITIAFILGFLLSKWGCGSVSVKTEYITKTDTVVTTQFIQSTPEVIFRDREKIVYKVKEGETKTNTITKTVEVKVPYAVTEIKIQERLIRDTTCQDSIRTLTAYVDSLKSQIDTLIELKNYRASISKKHYNLSYDILGRDVKSVETTVGIKDKLHFFPSLILTNPTATDRYQVGILGQFSYNKIIAGVGYDLDKRLIFNLGIKLF